MYAGKKMAEKRNRKLLLICFFFFSFPFCAHMSLWIFCFVRLALLFSAHHSSVSTTNRYFFYLPMFSRFVVLIIKIIGSFYVTVAVATVAAFNVRCCCCRIKSIISIIVISVVAGILMNFESQVISISG